MQRLHEGAFLYMQIIGTDHCNFNKYLENFSEFPKVIPGSSLMAVGKKPIALFCVYHDAGVLFLHGIFLAKNTSKVEVTKAIKLFEKFLILHAVRFSIVALSNTPIIKKILVRNKFKTEAISMMSRSV